MINETGLSVSELNLMISEYIRRDPRFRSVLVRGEVSSFRNQIASGHWYFSLKDANATIPCAMFRGANLKAQIRPKDGDQVLAEGYVDFYGPQGKIQLIVMSLRSAGLGEMYIRLEELKRKLDAEGLFDPARKRQLPMKPRKVAVVTSASGAALHDILNVSGARCPWVPVVLVPTAVQGERASAEIARNIRRAAEETGADVIVVARGGGSAEDLWCFNAEEVARAVAASPVPVVSGVGHEIDTTICDLAADVRAATPSNAAEIVFPDRKELAQRVSALRMGISRAARERILLAEREVRETGKRLGALSPDKRIDALSARSRLTREALKNAVNRRAEAAGMNVRRLREKLEAINPLGVLERGYALIYAGDGKLVTRRAEAEKEKQLAVRFADGRIEVETTGRPVQ